MNQCFNKSNAYENILYSLPGYCFWKNTEHEYEGANLNMLHAAKLNCLVDIIGKKDYDLPWQQFANNYINDDKLVITGKKAINKFEPFIVDDTVVIVRVHKAPIYDKSQQILGIVGCANIVTTYHLDKAFNKMITLEKPLQFSCKYLKKIFSPLSQREIEILALLARGYSVKCMATKLFISPRTVEQHLTNCKQKLKCHHKTALTIKAIAMGLTSIIPESIYDKIDL